MDFVSLAESLLAIFFGIQAQRYKKGKLKLSKKREILRQKRLNTKYGKNVLSGISIFLLLSGLFLLTITIAKWLDGK